MTNSSLSGAFLRSLAHHRLRLPTAEEQYAQRQEFIRRCHALAMPSAAAIDDIQASGEWEELLGRSCRFLEYPSRTGWPGCWLTNIPVPGQNNLVPQIGVLVGFHASDVHVPTPSLWTSIGLYGDVAKLLSTSHPSREDFKSHKIIAQEKRQALQTTAAEILLNSLARYVAGQDGKKISRSD